MTKTPSSQIDGALNGFAITPDDDNNLPHNTRAIYVGTSASDSLHIITLNGDEIELLNVIQGAVYPICVSRVLEDTTATNLIGLY